MADQNSYRIEAVTVNHNTSLFTELMLRSLLAKTSDTLDLSLTVIDNQSIDGQDLLSLKEFCNAQNIPFIQSGFDTKAETVNTHGEILQSFALSHTGCTHYLFIDTDTYIMHENTLDSLLYELESDPHAFGIAPRFHIYWENESDDDDDDDDNDGDDNVFSMTYSIEWWEGFESPTITCKAMGAPRLHPAFALVKNTPVFRDVVREIGFSCAWTFEEEKGAWYDTFALMTKVMKTHGLHPKLSTIEILHFFGVTYDELWQEQEGTNSKKDLALKLMSELRENSAAKE